VGAINYVDARDVAFVHAEALERGTPGERYLCVGENLELRDLGRRMAALTGRENPHVGMPRWFLLAYAAVAESFDKLRGVEPGITRSSMSESAWRWSVYDGRKTREAFGWEPRTLEDMLENTIRWGVFMGRVPAAGLDERLTRPDPAWVR
jgi:dihydroflavonol-4-reductase